MKAHPAGIDPCVVAITAALILTACATSGGTGLERGERERAVAEQVERLLPAALAFYREVVERQWPRGRPLTNEERAIAVSLGVRRPDRVRILVLDAFPLPRDPALRKEAERYGLGRCIVAGFAVGYVIMLKPGDAADRELLAHELVHVVQQERDGPARFVRRVLTEYRTMGRARAPLEVEAREQAARFAR